MQLLQSTFIHAFVNFLQTYMQECISSKYSKIKLCVLSRHKWSIDEPFDGFRLDQSTEKQQQCVRTSEGMQDSNAILYVRYFSAILILYILFFPALHSVKNTRFPRHRRENGRASSSTHPIMTSSGSKSLL